MEQADELALQPIGFPVGQVRDNHALNNGRARPYSFHQLAVHSGQQMRDVLTATSSGTPRVHGVDEQSGSCPFADVAYHALNLDRVDISLSRRLSHCMLREEELLQSRPYS